MTDDDSLPSPRRRRWLWIFAAIAALIAVAAAIAWWALLRRSIESVPPPPPVVASTLPAAAASTIALPVRIPLAPLVKQINAAVPQKLWSIDQPGSTCLAPAKVKLFKTRINVTPKIKCRIVGDVTRGDIRVSGSGDKIILTMPVNAVFQAKDIAGISDHKPVTASAQITARLLPTMLPNGNLSARISLSYDWRKEPETKVLGQRIRFTDKADQKLAPIFAKAEAQLARKLASLPLRSQLESVWKQGFTVQSLNRDNPVAWLRLTPQKLAAGAIRVEGSNMRIDAQLTALAEVKLGTEPLPPEPTALPRLSALGKAGGLKLNVPILAEYSQLEPILEKALDKVAADGIKGPDGGRIKVSFGTPTLYATANGRLALGLEIAARGPRRLLDTRGIVWLTADAETAPDSEKVMIRDIVLEAGQSGMQFQLLIDIAQSVEVREAIENALTQDFSRDYLKLVAKIDTALKRIRVGPFQLAATLNDMHHSPVEARGQGLFMMVTGTGSARLDYAGPRRPPGRGPRAAG